MKTVNHEEHEDQEEEYKLRVLRDLRGVFLKSWVTTFKLTTLSDCPGHISCLPVFLDIMHPKYLHARHNT
jgi:hypothetical protein